MPSNPFTVIDGGRGKADEQLIETLTAPGSFPGSPLFSGYRRRRDKPDSAGTQM